MSEEDRAYVAQRKDEVEELRARCRGLEQLLTAYEQSRGKELERIQQLEDALREVQKQAESFEMYHLDMARKPDPWMHQIRNITGAALYREAPEKEE